MSMKKCQRCSSDFKCQADNIEACGCAKISLSKSTNEYLAKTNYDCLCSNCLNELNNLMDDLKTDGDNGLVENKHYYLENGLMVFTERYHLERGFCCKSNCRHCAYGFKFVKPKLN